MNKQESKVEMRPQIIIKFPDEEARSVDHEEAMGRPPIYFDDYQDQLKSQLKDQPSALHQSRAIVSEAVEAPKQKQRPERKHGIIKKAKAVGAVGVLSLAAVGAYKLYDMWPSFGATHEVELTLGAPETEVQENVELELATINTEFPLNLHTSLDRVGPFNCDINIKNTGKKGEGKKVHASSEAGYKIERLELHKLKNGRVTVDISGDLTLDAPAFPVDQNDFVTSVGDVDVCIGTNELNSARKIAATASEGAAKVAVACALQDPVGKETFRSSLKKFANATNIGRGVPADKIDVDLGEYDQMAKNVYDGSVAQLDSSLDEVINEYIKQTTDHDRPKIDDASLKNCGDHTIKFIPN